MEKHWGMMWKDGVEEVGGRLNDMFRRGEINEQPSSPPCSISSSFGWKAFSSSSVLLILFHHFHIVSSFSSGSERGPSDLGTFPTSPSTPSPFSGVFPLISLFLSSSSVAWNSKLFSLISNSRTIFFLRSLYFPSSSWSYKIPSISEFLALMRLFCLKLWRCAIKVLMWRNRSCSRSGVN